MWTAKSSWANRLLIAIPLASAALLNAAMVGVEHLHLRLDYIARYGFVFSGPWRWLEGTSRSYGESPGDRARLN